MTNCANKLNSEQNRLTAIKQRPIPIHLKITREELLKQRMNKVDKKNDEDRVQSATISKYRVNIN